MASEAQLVFTPRPLEMAAGLIVDALKRIGPGARLAIPGGSALGALHLVREALAEREVLWRIAPHIIHPLRFVLPHVPGLRPRWLLRLGLFLYDHIGGRKRLPATRSIDLARHPAGVPLKPGFHAAFEYSDRDRRE